VSATLTPRKRDKALESIPGYSEKVRHHRPSKLLAIIVLSAISGLLVAVLAVPVIGSIGIAAKGSADFFDNLPTQLVVPPLPQRSVILDRYGHPIATLHGPEDRVSVSFTDIAPQMRNAIVGIEDRRFYQHHGVDYKGLIRAALTNQENGSVTQGGSTLTQQYVKNVLLEEATTPAEKKAATDRSVQRKLREARYALALERKLSKDQILTNYLNIANFGDGAYGVETAAEHYFGIHAKQLNVVQAATLAGIVNAPTEYDPKLHPQASLKRRNVVIDSMVTSKYLTKVQAKYAKTFPLGIVKTPPAAADACTAAGTAAYFCDYVRSTLLNDPKFGATSADRSRRLFEGGLTIKTSFDPQVQEAAQQAVDTIVPTGGRIATADVVMKPGTGEVLAMAINRTYGDTTDHLPVFNEDPKTGKITESKDQVHTKFNYATADAFQAGSTFKLFTLAAALEKGLSTATTFNSPACIYLANFPYGNPLNPGANCVSDTPSVIAPPGVGYSNAGDSEACTCNMINATSGSVNTYFVQLEKKVGVPAVRDMAIKLGVQSPSMVGPNALVGSLTLGSREVSPLDMATAYATVAAQGLRCYPKPVLSMSVGGKPVAYTGPPKCQQVLSQGIANTITSMLEGVITGGTASANGPIGRPAAGKTGTTDQHYDAWFDGYIPQLAAAVWVGDGRNPTLYPMEYAGYVAPGQTVSTIPDGTVVGGVPQSPVFGGDLPTKVWAATMRQAVINLNLPVVDLPPPDYSVEQGAQAVVPNVAGMDIGSAEAALSAAGFTPIQGGTSFSSYAPGLVAFTTPGGFSQASEGSGVTIIVSSGAAPPPPPSKAPTTKPTTKGKTPVTKPTTKPGKGRPVRH
jgi:membrane peptidoglycan carboxypeptidase